MSDRPVGRPREVDDPVRVNVSVPARDYDRLDHAARQKGLTVPAIIRQAISVLNNRRPPGSSSQ
jgi:hypothetical protein